MKNKEKYAKEILEIACSGNSLAFDKTTNKVVPCKGLQCSDCLFYHHCFGKEIKEWCESEYVEPPVDWSKVPVDTPILVRDSEDEEWRNRYFAKYRYGGVFSFSNGATSWSAENNEDCVWWKYAKLAEPNNT